MRTALAALCLAAVMGLAVIVTSQLGGLDRHELSGLMGAPAPEQVTASSEPDDNDTDPFAGQPVEDADDSGAAASSQEMPPAVTATSPLEPRDAGAGTTEPEAPAPSAELVAPATRNVTAPGMTPAPAVTGPLEREAVPKQKPAPPRWRTYAPVIVREAGLLDIGARNVRLADIAMPDDDRLCHPAETGETATKIACSKLALVELRRRIRALGVECQISANDTSDPIVAPCRIGATDLGLWLVEQGWAEAAAKAPDGYRAAQTEARCARRGIWQAGPQPADCLQN